MQINSNFTPQLAQRKLNQNPTQQNRVAQNPMAQNKKNSVSFQALNLNKLPDFDDKTLNTLIDKIYQRTVVNLLGDSGENLLKKLNDTSKNISDFCESYSNKFSKNPDKKKFCESFDSIKRDLSSEMESLKKGERTPNGESVILLKSELPDAPKRKSETSVAAYNLGDLAPKLAKKFNAELEFDDFYDPSNSAKKVLNEYIQNRPNAVVTEVKYRSAPSYYYDGWGYERSVDGILVERKPEGLIKPLHSALKSYAKIQEKFDAKAIDKLVDDAKSWMDNLRTKWGPTAKEIEAQKLKEIKDNQDFMNSL